MKQFVFVSCMIIAVLAGACQRTSPDWARHVIFVHVTKQAPDYASPWFKAATSNETHLAVYIGGGKFLTSAFSVHDAALIELEFLDTQKRVPANVVFRDREVNLALVQPADQQIPDSIKQVNLTTAAAEGDDLRIVVQRSPGRIETRRAHLAEISQRSSVLSPYLAPTYELETGDQRNYGWSEPVFLGNRFAGLTTGSSGSSVLAVSAMVIERFVKDWSPGPYRGFPALGIQVRPLVSPEYRMLLSGMAEGSGVVIAAVHANSPFHGQIVPDDILTHVDGYEVDQQGYVRDAVIGRIHFTYVLASKFSGDPIGVQVLRGGKSLSLSSNLRRFDSDALLIPYSSETGQPYLIVGGFVFQELTKGLLESFGRDWQEAAPPHWMLYWAHRNLAQRSPFKRVVVLTRVLADQGNDGYHALDHLILRSVNGKPVESIQQLNELLTADAAANSRMIRFDFALDGGQAWVDLTKVGSIHQRLRNTLNIPQAAHFFQR